jgi:hypothetical protein
MILGPTLGGAMYEAGGFSLPFAVLGGCLLFQVPVPSYILQSTILQLFSRFFPNAYVNLLACDADARQIFMHWYCWHM